jgi:hypothetical protein
MAYRIQLPPEYHEKWAFPSGPYQTVTDAQKAVEKLRRKLPTVPMTIVADDDAQES